MPTTHAGIHTRWLIRKDLPTVLAIEDMVLHQNAWVEEDFLAHLRQRNCIAMVAEVKGEIAGHMVYLLCNDKFRLLRFAVHPRFQRQRVATELVKRLKEKLSHTARTAILTVVHEDYLSGQLLLQSLGFRATNILRNHFSDDRDGYLMRYQLPSLDEQSTRDRLWEDFFIH